MLLMPKFLKFNFAFLPLPFVSLLNFAQKILLLTYVWNLKNKPKENYYVFMLLLQMIENNMLQCRFGQKGVTLGTRPASISSTRLS